jgi:uncharacterized membrane protein YphA (DoxX/SURF4 family)
MAVSASESPRWGQFGPDPGRSLRVWVTLLLRFGIGLSLLSTGLAGYFGASTGFAAPGRNSFSMIDPFLSGLPYVAIALGLALVLGFLTTASSIAAGFFALIPLLLSMVQLAFSARSGLPGFGGRWGNDYIAMMGLAGVSNLLPNAALIWLSPLENNPYSVDAMIFGRNEIEPSSRGPAVDEPSGVVEPSVVEPPTIRIDD